LTVWNAAKRRGRASPLYHHVGSAAKKLSSRQSTKVYFQAYKPAS
jgi:hypothetical protein